ncbi:MAG: M20/M25/M40 family metallo-hydrolase, partial [Anaerolineales bacterium]
MTITNYLEENLPRYLGLLQHWVETNSFTANPAGVDAVAKLTAAAFVDLGFVAEYIPSQNANHGNHLVLTRQGNTNRKLGLISHLDTVFPPEEEAANDFHWRVVGDRIYGPGTNDVKGGTLTILMLLEALQRFAAEDFAAITWVVLLNAAEETLSND